LLTGGVASACLVDVPDSAAGKPCPCPYPGYWCTDGVCVETASRCLVGATDFAPAWSTPSSIRWDWKVQGEARHFVEYRLVVAPSEAELEAATSETPVLSAATRSYHRGINPELGHYYWPDQGSTLPVDFTVSDGLSPSEDADESVGRYFGRLMVTDVKGCVFSTPVLQTTTKRAPTNAIVISDDTVPPPDWGGIAPVVAEDCGRPEDGGDPGDCLRCDAACLGDPEAWKQLRLVQPIDLSSVPASAFDSGLAHLEVWVAVVSTNATYYNEIVFMRHNGAPNAPAAFTAFGARPVVFPPSLAAEPEYERIQLPLNALSIDDGRQLAHADLLTGGFDELHIGSSFTGASEVRFDAIYVRW
jgi:hypothetical protein